MLRFLAFMLSPLFLLVSCGGTPDYNPLSIEWARYIRGNPGGVKSGSRKSQESLLKALALEKTGYNLYRSKKDRLAVLEYEKALRLHATGRLYFRYANSLSNIPRLKDSAQAYRIARALGYRNDGVLAYNAACAYSRMGNAKKAMKMLKQAVQDGYRAFQYMLRDTDLENVRNDSSWQSQYMFLRRMASSAYFNTRQEKHIRALFRNGKFAELVQLLKKNPSKTLPEQARASMYTEALLAKSFPKARFAVKYLIRPNDAVWSGGYKIGMSVVVLSVIHRQPGLAMQLIKMGANVTKIYHTGPDNVDLIGEAAANGYSPIVKICLDAGVDPDSHPGKFGNTPLIRSVMGGHIDTVRILLKAGASVSYSPYHGGNALTLAIGYRNTRMIALIRKYVKGKADVSLKQFFSSRYMGRRLINRKLDRLFYFSDIVTFQKYGIGGFWLSTNNPDPTVRMPDYGSFRLIGDTIHLVRRQSYMQFSLKFRIKPIDEKRIMINGKVYTVGTRKKPAYFR